MNNKKDDWRLTNQESYLTGVSVRYREYKMPRPDWDHDHYEFCFVTFMEQHLPDTLQHGYVTQDGKWICSNCFEDVRQQFGWTLTS